MPESRKKTEKYKEGTFDCVRKSDNFALIFQIYAYVFKVDSCLLLKKMR